MMSMMMEGEILVIVFLIQMEHRRLFVISVTLDIPYLVSKALKFGELLSSELLCFASSLLRSLLIEISNVIVLTVVYGLINYDNVWNFGCFSLLCGTSIPRTITYLMRYMRCIFSFLKIDDV